MSNIPTTAVRLRTRSSDWLAGRFILAAVVLTIAIYLVTSTDSEPSSTPLLGPARRLRPRLHSISPNFAHTTSPSP
ncbi:uncharacterized protein SCHCODRAFT_02632933 [Schizophyllum commune H4-8]|uniref:uncharacterized protein n=1 Tax=Schizophyllum commune (strain H4-8 / FGSC 9210) TaxID=578458 RepID=UPI00215E7370|nr:uncharacterized protein SCHCODRAFT_02632933 [Schizophyllum commune H4-8]KAI5890802.1 hypothetical protein SCHCODRAFT_02632933 [Schizophyllum commune H4-8]